MVSECWKRDSIKVARSASFQIFRSRRDIRERPVIVTKRRPPCYCRPSYVISLQSRIIMAVNNISPGFRCETHARAVGSRDRLRQKDELRDQTTCIFETNEACRFAPSRNCRPSGHCGNNGANNSNSRHNGIGRLGNGVIETEVIHMVPGSTRHCNYVGTPVAFKI